jgi:hypothetical protein
MDSPRSRTSTQHGVLAFRFGLWPLVSGSLASCQFLGAWLTISKYILLETRLGGGPMTILHRAIVLGVCASAAHVASGLFCRNAMSRVGGNRVVFSLLSYREATKRSIGQGQSELPGTTAEKWM